MASKSMASPAAVLLLFLTAGLMLAATAQAQRPAPGPLTPGVCPVGFANSRDLNQATVQYAQIGTAVVGLPESLKPYIRTITSSFNTNVVTVCSCYYRNLNVFGPYKCEKVIG
jgi:predicted transglutaminase-like cysteine proteinase